MYQKEKNFGSKVYSMYVYSILILSFIALISFWAYSMYEFNEREKRNIKNVLDSVSQNLELQFAEIKKINDAFYFNDVFQKAEQMNNPKLYAYYDEIKLINIEKAYTMTLHKMMHTSSQTIRTIAFFPVSGKDHIYCLGKGNSEIQRVRYQDYKDERWYQQAVANPQRVVFYKPHIPCYMENSRLGPVYSYICGVKNQDTQRLIGIVKVDVDAKEMLETLQMFAGTGGNDIVLLNNGEIFAKSGELEQEIDSYLISKQEIKNTNLEVAYLNTFWRQYGGYMNITIGSVAVILLAALLAFLNYRKQAKEMVNDMRQIMSVIKEVEVGKMDSRIEIQGESEYIKIANVINRMLDNLKEYIDREYVLVIQQQKAQYQALQSQINPHFLYNTLNGFVALNRMGEKEILEKSIIELSRLFRYTCSAKDIVTVKEEMAFLSDYLKLEKLKYEDKLEYVIDVDDECKDKKIPKLLLQPIVENSIKHGRGNTDQPIEIEIYAKNSNINGTGKAMVLVVRDNGVGFDMETEASRDEHVGIENVRTRAKLHCENVEYQCISKPGKGTATMFIFPEEGGK